jgi:hypothetical protein
VEAFSIVDDRGLGLTGVERRGVCGWLDHSYPRFLCAKQRHLPTLCLRLEIVGMQNPAAADVFPPPQPSHLATSGKMRLACALARRASTSNCKVWAGSRAIIRANVCHCKRTLLGDFIDIGSVLR